MTQPYIPRTVLALAVAALVAACGGEGTSPSAQEFASAIRPNAPHSDRLRALGVGGGSTGAAATAITNAQLFQWAVLTYPELFPGTAIPLTVPYEGKVYDVRAFLNGNYIGVADGVAYGYGPFVGGGLFSFGPVSQFADLVCSKVNCGSTGGGGGGTGALNGCTIGAAESLRTGSTYSAVYVSSVLVAPTSSGEYTIQGTVNGPTAFEGQTAVKSTITTRGTQFGVTLDATVLSYQVAADNDLVRTLGSEASITFQGFPATTKMVFAAPASLNNEFTLAVGSSLTKTETATSTTVIPSLPIPVPPSTNTSSATHTFEARETVTVLGRSYDTCRYKMVTPESAGATTSWYIYGKGFPAKVEATSAAGAVEYRSELKSGTINGAAI